MTATVKKPNAFSLSPKQIIQQWLDFEARGMDWKRIGPKDFSNCSADFKQKLEETVWCCRVVDRGFEYMKARSDFVILRSYLFHTRHHGKTPETFWLTEAGAVLEPAVERFERCIAEAARGIKRSVEFEGG